MSYQVIARKWRPQAFEEVTGQEHITRTLRNAIEHERLHHAYLFSGARGVGKTTTARLLAKAVNCHRADKPTPSPCKTTDADQCPSCREVAEGRSIDVLEIDAASNTGVDNVRDAIINTVGVRPARDRYKVFIIDEVHMLSVPAFNALLKTLEEPPPRVLFIMATTHAHKVPETILSRSQQFEFRTIAAAKIAERLRLIADAEKIKVGDDALREIARAGEGSMRDAQSAFDQVISFSEGEIETADVEAALGLAGTEMLARVMRSVAAGAPAEALAVVDDLVVRGHDLRNFCRDLMGHLRDLLVTKVAGGASPLADGSDAERKALAAEADEFSESDLVRFFHSLTETEKNLREGAHPRYQLEIGLVKLVEMRRLAPLARVIERLGALEEALRTGKAPAATTTGGPGAAGPPGATPVAGGGNAPRRGSGAATGGGSAAPHTPQAFNPPTAAAAKPSAAEVKSADSYSTPAPARTTTTTTATATARAATTTQAARPSAPVESPPPSATHAPNLKLVPAHTGNAADDLPPFPLDDEPSFTRGAPPFARDAPPEEPSYFADIPAGEDRAGPPVAFVPSVSPSSSSSSPSFGGAAEADDIVSRLKHALEARNKSLLVAALDAAQRVTFGDGVLCAEFAPEPKFMRDTLDKADSKCLLREVCAELTGRETEVRVVVHRPGEVGAALTERDAALLEQKRLRERYENDPRVQPMLKTFRAEIVEVRRSDDEPR
ncbi:MAG TPA: DNA polymerase III subunit gamma/tau [Pyrinomonadaceae bacterium]